MTILHITPQTNLRTAAITCLGQGLSVIPLMGKKPALPSWSPYQRKRAELSDVLQWERDGRLQNIGVVCGQVSGNLIVMDLDGESAVRTFEATFPHLLNTFTVITGSGRGKHLYFRVDHLPPTTRLLNGNHNNIELRSNGLYVVSPPSIHPDTHKPYNIGVFQPIRRLPDLNAVRDWMISLNARKPAPPKPGGMRTIGVGRFANIANPQAWTNAALNKEIQAVRSSTEGARNHRLNTAAYNLGQIVGLGWLSWGAAEQALLDAARGCRLSEGEALRTIHSGLEKGANEPRDAQWQKRRT